MGSTGGPAVNDMHINDIKFNLASYPSRTSLSNMINYQHP
jgi:hypothetical protein